ncbi:hypothetical protein EPH_0010170 [Eimeria praecox]|uniref:Uncharacterized protein n=1 Tax=Eimeria praecox TaxID=51316 RepID=U6GNT4_9EIME|nr:hypothetical protein EPH_0010170 [Eimeria praecox]
MGALCFRLYEGKEGYLCACVSIDVLSMEEETDGSFAFTVQLVLGEPGAGMSWHCMYCPAEQILELQTAAVNWHCVEKPPLLRRSLSVLSRMYAYDQGAIGGGVGRMRQL